MKLTKEQAKEQKTGQELLQKLATKAWESATFKEQLISNPEDTIKSVIGKKLNLPEGTKLIVEDQTDSNIIYLNIPQKPDFDNMELSDEELEQVSGGIAPILYVIFLAAVAIGQAAQ